MTDLDSDKIVVLNWYKTRTQKLAMLGHIHDVDGTCMKRRQGPKCSGLDRQKVPVLQ